jgi:Zn-finger nucleic acid-binding protein
MQIGQRGDLRFDYCGAHGLWLDAGEVWRLSQVFKLS